MTGTRLRILGVVVAACLLAGCSEGEESGGGPPSGPYPDQILSDFEVEMMRGELRSAVIEASRGVIYRSRDSMIVDELTARLYDSEGLYSSTLRADSGLLRERRRSLVAHGDVQVIDRDSLRLFSDSLFWHGELGAVQGGAVRDTAVPGDERYMVAKGNVHLITRDSVHLWTDTLLWNDFRSTVATDAFVTIVRSGADTLRGYGLRSDDQLQTITIQRSVSGRIREQSR